MGYSLPNPNKGDVFPLLIIVYNDKNNTKGVGLGLIGVGNTEIS